MMELPISKDIKEYYKKRNMEFTDSERATLIWNSLLPFNEKLEALQDILDSTADERGLKISTIDSIHTVLHQVLELAVEDNYVRYNVSDNLLKELKQAHNFGDSHKRALTVPEQELFMNFLSSEKTQYHHWYPIFRVMLGTGMRVGEICRLRWEDIDLENGMIDVNHTLVYYNHEVNGCYFNINTSKTRAGKRQIRKLTASRYIE